MYMTVVGIIFGSRRNKIREKENSLKTLLENEERNEK